MHVLRAKPLCIKENHSTITLPLYLTVTELSITYCAAKGWMKDCKIIIFGNETYHGSICDKRVIRDASIEN